ncbi:protein transport protein Sec24-like [Musa troglodytarum]|uniref:Protein transport protein Sec24-like n=1 Tax=Musa troglodytarum TaxID=320322 RepID=A0A9E7HHY1_9LILI|nr:protein transport protein Sec24-like [Musa troglodytarum]
MQAYPAAHVPPIHTSQYHAHQSLVPPPPPVGGPMGFSSREQLQHPLTGPPIGGVQGLVEEFQSLTVGSVPGALDPEVDTKSLPRPLNGDEEPTKILEVYPFNCHLRFMRLTTHAIPNSQSLLSRWHLPLGAVVHPLAEAPDGLAIKDILPRQADTGAIVSLLGRLAIENSLSQKLEDARQSLKEYRNLYVVQHRLGGREID